MQGASRTQMLVAVGALVLLATVSAAIWKSSDSPLQLNRTTVELFEAKLHLPEGAYPLDRYVRFYIRFPRNGRDYILGTFVERAFSSTIETPSEQQPPIVFPSTPFGVNDLPCPAQIFVWYDLESRETLVPGPARRSRPFPRKRLGIFASLLLPCSEY